jgi:transcriptional regulator with XRE-family HTH domain
MNFVSQNIKYLRAKKKLSQFRLAEQLRLSRNQINSYESANSQPSIDVLKQIAIFFNISIDDLISIHLNKNNYEQVVENQQDELIVLKINQMFCNLQSEIERKNKQCVTIQNIKQQQRS